MSIHTYIIGHYNPYGQDDDLVSHTIYVVCVNIICKWRDLQFKIDCERQIFKKPFMTILFAPKVFARNLLTVSLGRNNFSFLHFVSDQGFEPGLKKTKMFLLIEF